MSNTYRLAPFKALFININSYFDKGLVKIYGKPSEIVKENARNTVLKINCLLAGYISLYSIKHLFVFTSVWRPLLYNIIVGGKKNSAHCKGLALDLFPPFLNTFLLFLRSETGVFYLKHLGLYYYIGYNDEGITFFHFQTFPTKYHCKKTNQFYTKQYPRKY